MNPPAISSAAITWYRTHGRKLPWRETTDPYAILVSEIMLQQTTIAAVIPFYHRFLERFPDVRELAQSDEQSVLAQWAGLGYYRRARSLHAAAREVVASFGGVFPADVAELQKLPGIGRYTAGAIASFAYDFSAPIVEANTARLLARLFAVQGKLSAGTVQRQLWTAAETLLPAVGARNHNSALMDLGATVCTLADPACEQCPLQAWCQAYQNNLVHLIPAPEEKVEKLFRAFAGVVLEADNRFLVRLVPAGEWHAGMFEFPKVVVTPDDSPEAMETALLEQLAPHYIAGSLTSFCKLQYVVTRHKITLHMWRGKGVMGPAGAAGVGHTWRPGEYGWLHLNEISQLPMASAQRRLFRMLHSSDDLFGMCMV